MPKPIHACHVGQSFAELCTRVLAASATKQHDKECMYICVRQKIFSLYPSLSLRLKLHVNAVKLQKHVYVYAYSGRSQMSCALFNSVADPQKAIGISAGTNPGSAVHENCVVLMQVIRTSCT